MGDTAVEGGSSGSGSDDVRRAAPIDLKRPNELECQVPGCTNDIVGCKDIHVRCRVCDMHFRAPVSLILGVEQRFCQLCGKFHLLSEFDGRKVSCREKLALHNKRRRDNRTKRRLAKSQGAQNGEMLCKLSPTSLDSTPSMVRRRSSDVQRLFAAVAGAGDSFDVPPANDFGSDHRLTAPDFQPRFGKQGNNSEKRARCDLDNGPVPWDRHFHSCPSGPADSRLIESCRKSLSSQYGAPSTEFEEEFWRTEFSCNSEMPRLHTIARWHETMPSTSSNGNNAASIGNNSYSKVYQRNGSLPFYMLDAESLLDTGRPQGSSELPWWRLTDLV